MPVAGRIPSGGGDSLAREIFAERKETIAKYVPTETQALYSRVIADLKETASPGGFCLKGARLHASISSITRETRFHRRNSWNENGWCCVFFAAGGARSASVNSKR